jgi:hypothetical protein
VVFAQGLRAGPRRHGVEALRILEINRDAARKLPKLSVGPRITDSIDGEGDMRFAGSIRQFATVTAGARACARTPSVRAAQTSPAHNGARLRGGPHIR